MADKAKAEKAKRGTKRVCGGCGAKFYDLNKEPAICPMCGAEFVIEKVETKAKAPEKAKPEEPKTEEVKTDIVLEGDDELVDIEVEETDDVAAGDDDDTFLEVEEDPEAAVAATISGIATSKDDEEG